MIHVYTGNGKGKTTAALGMALRAAGHGLKVYIAQFVKGAVYGELRALKKLRNITIRQFGRRCFIRGSPAKADYKFAQDCLKAVGKAISCAKFSLIVLDEANVAVRLGLISPEELLEVIKSAPKDVEIVITGRSAHPKIIKAADLVSRIDEVKHYYRKGVKARRGIEY